MGDLGGGKHAAADEGDFAVVAGGDVDDLLDAVDGAGEGGEDEFLGGAGEDLFEAGADGAFAFAIAGALDVGGVAHQEEDAALAVFGEGMKVEVFVVDGGLVDFEVGGVDDDAEWGGDGEGDAGDGGVGDADEVDLEGADGDAVAGLDFAEVGVLEELVFLEAALGHGESEGGAIDGDVELGEEIGGAADVVFVGVGKDESADFVAVLLEIGEVGGNDVDAEEFGVGEHHARVDDDDVVVVAESHGVHAELAQPAEGDNLQLTRWHSVFYFSKDKLSGA